MSTFREALNDYGKRREPCFFVVDFDKTHFHIEPLDDPSGKVWYDVDGVGYDAPLLTKTKIALHKKPISKERYTHAFNEVIEQIKSGNTYLLNLTFPTKLDGTLSLEQLYHASDAPFRCMMKDTFVCFSPERFIKIYREAIHTYPMKGTIDAAIPHAKGIILSDPKEMAEHVMVVDLLRNDLSMIASHVCVQQFRYVEKIKAGEKELLHVSSEVTGLMHQGWQDRLGDIFDRVLPAGSITGTPKKKTVEIIKAVEGYERGFFTGVFGIYDGENVDSAVMIRYIEKSEDGYVYKSGGGITLESDVNAEYQEMCDKVYVPVF